MNLFQMRGGEKNAFDLKSDFSLSSYQIMGKSSSCLELHLLLLLQEMHMSRESICSI